MSALPPDLPPRMTTSELCALGRISKRTFQRRRRTGRYLIEPCDRGAEDLWSRDEVARIFNLKLPGQAAPAPENPRVDPDAIRAARAGQVRQRPGPARGRDVPRPVRGSGQAPAVRLAFDATAAD